MVLDKDRGKIKLLFLIWEYLRSAKFKSLFKF